MRKQTQMHQVVVAASLLAAGLLMVLLNRPADQIYFIPDWFLGIAFLENTFSYFPVRAYDLLDLMPVALGGVTAYRMIRYFQIQENGNVTKL